MRGVLIDHDKRAVGFQQDIGFKENADQAESLFLLFKMRIFKNGLLGLFGGGGNQPVRDVKGIRTYITSQNHGYAVDNDNLPDNATLRFINCNDGSCEGLDYSDMPAFSVQFMPQINGGPLDTRFLFDRFIALMGGNKECR